MNLGSRYEIKIHAGPEAVFTGLDSRVATQFIYFASLMGFQNRYWQSWDHEISPFPA